MKSINPVTLAFVIIAALGFGLMAARGFTPEQMAGIAAAVVAAGSQLDKLVSTTKPNDPPSPPPPVGPAMMLVAALGLFPFTTACATLQAQKAAAETDYLGEQLRCVDKANTRAEADTCRKAVREKWGIAETQTAKGAGQ